MHNILIDELLYVLLWSIKILDVVLAYIKLSRLKRTCKNPTKRTEKPLLTISILESTHYKFQKCQGSFWTT